MGVLCSQALINDGYYASYLLTDLTSAALVDQFTSSPEWPGATWDWTRTYGLDTNHLYQLELEATAGSYDGGSLNMKAELVTFIPAPSAFLLVGIGTALVDWLHRRRTV